MRAHRVCGEWVAVDLRRLATSYRWKEAGTRTVLRLPVYLRRKPFARVARGFWARPASFREGPRRLALSFGYLKPGVPSGSPATARWPDVAHIEACREEEPGDHRVGVPHLTSTKLVPPPYRPGYDRHELEDQLGTRHVGRDPFDGHGIVTVRDTATAPTAELVARDP